MRVQSGALEFLKEDQLSFSEQDWPFLAPQQQQQQSQQQQSQQEQRALSRASLGVPDILVLTPDTAREDERIRDKLASQRDFVYASMRLACSFDPGADHWFSEARFMVELSRDDGVDSPLPIAFSLIPMDGDDGITRESSVEIGSDLKFVSARLNRKDTREGSTFIRGFGVQEAVSYWEFTPTPSKRLEGAYLLWMIVKAPAAANLVFSSRLEVEIYRRRWWGGKEAADDRLSGVRERTFMLRLIGEPRYELTYGGS